MKCITLEQKASCFDITLKETWVLRRSIYQAHHFRFILPWKKWTQKHRLLFSHNYTETVAYDKNEIKKHIPQRTNMHFSSVLRGELLDEVFKLDLSCNGAPVPQIQFSKSVVICRGSMAVIGGFFSSHNAPGSWWHLLLTSEKNSARPLNVFTAVPTDQS